MSLQLSKFSLIIVINTKCLFQGPWLPDDDGLPNDAAPDDSSHDDAWDRFHQVCPVSAYAEPPHPHLGWRAMSSPSQSPPPNGASSSSLRSV